MNGQPACALVLMAAVMSLLTWSNARADEPIPHGQDALPGLPLSPADAVNKMTVPKGFRVEVVASEPEIVNPVAMTFDERGRIWITESIEYPRQSPGPGRDRIKILEDTDGDGKADKFTVFAEGLNIPSGIAVGHGGVWVGNAPDILFLQDTDGDGKADKREVVVTGFGRFDTHELPNSLSWGPDGWLYGWNGVFNYSHIEYRGKTYDFTCALFRIHPKTREFELFSIGTSNPWGITWNGEGSAFASACVIDHLWNLTESGHYIRQGGPNAPFAWPIGSIVDHRHQKAAYAGITYFDSDAYPAEFRERLYMGNIHGNCINVDSLTRNGSTYKGITKPDLLAANDAWFMPIAQKTGPDGCLYILDWYDRYHCYQDAGRDPGGIDRLKGRLYRVRYQNTPRAEGFDLSKESNNRLIERLASPNIYFREQAQRVLAERNDPGARKTLEAIVLDSSKPKKQRTGALWTLAGGGEVEPSFLESILAQEDATLRSWGVRIAGNRKKVDDAIRSKIAGLAADPDPDVRLQVAIASTKIEGLDPILVLLNVLKSSSNDPLIPQIVWQNLHPLLGSRGLEFVARLDPIALEKAPAVCRILPKTTERLLANGAKDDRAIVALVERIALGEDRQIATAADCLKVLINAIQAGEIAGDRLEQLRKTLAHILTQIDVGDVRNELAWRIVLLNSAWKDSDAINVLTRMLEEPAGREDRRLEALEALVKARDERTFAAVARILAEKAKGSSEFHAKVISALGKSDDIAIARVILAAYPNLEPALKPSAIELLTQRVEWSKALLDAVGNGKIPPSELNVNQVRKLLSSKDKDLLRRVNATWGTLREERNPKSEDVIGRMREMVRKTPGDPFAGEQVFKKVCAQCHAIYGAGQDVGPDLTGNGRGSFEQLLSNVFDPSLVIGASYQAVTVATQDGRILTGLMVEDSPRRIILKTQGGKRETIPRGEIDETKTSKLSLMPEDLEKQLSAQEIVDLLAFLCLDKHPGDPAGRRLAGSGQIKTNGADKSK